MASKAGLIIAIVIAVVLITFPAWAPLLAPSSVSHGGGYGAAEHTEHGEHGASETSTTTCITGKLMGVDMNDKSIVVNGVKIYVKGRWSVNGESYNPYDMLSYLEKHMGSKITVCYYISENGEKMASKIIVAGTTATRE
ncbi:MAG: hypothetical protein GXO09_04420 [Crenarchaeota archaeon]|nr:hypothetical protein [Thermoproteota archaeon]